MFAMSDNACGEGEKRKAILPGRKFFDNRRIVRLLLFEELRV